MEICTSHIKINSTRKKTKMVKTNKKNISRLRKYANKVIVLSTNLKEVKIFTTFLLKTVTKNFILAF